MDDREGAGHRGRRQGWGLGVLSRLGAWRPLRKVLAWLSGAGLCAVAALAYVGCHRGHVRPAAGARGYGNLPLSFEPNLGQAGPSFRFLSNGGGYSLGLAPAKAVLRLSHAVVSLDLMGADPSAKGGLQGRQPGQSNYLRGSDPRHWTVHVPQFDRAEFQDVYPGINLAYYGNQGHLEYDFVARPGADWRAIEWSIRGASPRLDAGGNLELRSKGGTLRFHRPLCRVTGPGARPLQGRYALRGRHRIGFEVAGLAAGETLVIDPVLDYQTYYGATGAATALGVAADPAGCAYITGWGGAGIQVTAGAYQTGIGSDMSAFVAKLNPSGTALVYATYLGGDQPSKGQAICVNAAGNAYITGYNQGHFPTTAGAFETAMPDILDSTMAFAAELSVDGSSLVYSTYLSGDSYAAGTSIALDSAGDAYVAGWAGAGFPVTAGAYQTTPMSPPVLGLNGFLTKLNPSGSAQVYSTYFGGPAFIQYLYVAVDTAGAAYLAGTAGSPFPVTAGAYQTVFGGGVFDAFVSKLNPAGSALVYSTFLGGDSYEMAEAIAVDGQGCAYVTGNTRKDFPVTAGAYDTVSGGRSQVFVAKLNAGGSALVYSTYAYGDAIGGSEGTGIAVDAAGNAYVSGDAGLSYIVPIPVGDPPPPGEPNSMVLAFGLNADGSALAELGVNQTMLGSNGGSSIALDPSGNIYVAGHSDGGIVATGGVLQSSAAGHGEAFVCKFGGPLAYATATPVLSATPSPSASPSPTAVASPVASRTPSPSPMPSWTPSPVATSPAPPGAGCPFTVAAVYPNPIPAAGAHFVVCAPGAGRVEIALYTLRGEKVATVGAALAGGGLQEIGWNVKNSAGQALAFGAYYALATYTGSKGSVSSGRWVTVMR
jgi:hypothetical protein